MSWRVQGCEVYCTSISRTQGSTATTTAGGGAGGGSALAAAAGYEGPCGNSAAHIVVHTENPYWARRLQCGMAGGPRKDRRALAEHAREDAGLMAAAAGSRQTPGRGTE